MRRWRMHLMLVVVGIVVGFVSECATAEQHYVSNTGNDFGNCGSYDQPCRLIRTAIKQAKSGDEVVLFEGEYAPPVELTIAQNLTYGLHGLHEFKSSRRTMRCSSGVWQI
jgi:hypothetical protein